MTRSVRRLRLLTGAIVVLLGCLAGCSAAAESPPAAAPSPPAIHPRGFHSVRTLPALAPPDRLRIPSIGVNTPLDRLGREADGSIQVPSRWQVAGWYQDGPTPGQPGPAAILGHVDSTSGPAVFARLRQLPTGADVLVDAGSSTIRFRVTGLAEFPKERFPTQEVYLPTLEPVLRLITCGGAFDPATGHYRDNVIVSATRVS
jgi:sortase (surface protein transpeptidase)